MEVVSQTGKRLQCLDAARAFAALLVVLAHGLEQCLPSSYDVWTYENLGLGRTGVLLFLIISGFVIPASLEKGGSIARFWLRRLFRLFPAYWLSIAAAYLYLNCGGTLGVSAADSSTWLINLTMLQSFLGVPDVNGVYWTLALELVIYAACTLLFVCGLLNRISGAAFAAVNLACAAYAVAQPLLWHRPFILDVSLSLYFAPLIGLLAQRYASGTLGRRRFYALVAFQGALVVLVWAVNRQAFPESRERMGLKTLAINWGAAYACFFLLLEMRHRDMPAIICRLGRISYSLYLFHLLLPIGRIGRESLRRLGDYSNFDRWLRGHFYSHLPLR